MRGLTQFRMVAAVALVALLGACGGGGSVGSKVGEKAPTFETFDLSGKEVALRDFRGEIVLVNFWASWCVPCRKEFPVLSDLHERDGVTVLGVVFNDSADDARRFMAERGAAWPGLIDDGGIAKAYGVGKRPGIPVTLVIDAKGVLRGKHIGEADRADLEELVQAAS